MVDSNEKEILAQLTALDLSHYPHNEIHALIRKLGKYGVIVTTFNPGQIFIRARVNKGSEIFSKVTDLSYKPAEFNTTYQRASTPAFTMFYGALLPKIIEGDLNNSRIIGSCEVCDLLRDKTITAGERRVTFGKWVVTQPIHVASIVHHEDYYNGNSYLKQMGEDYKRFITVHSEEMIKKSMMISEYFATQFAKAEIGHHYEYMLSAIYAERMAQMKPTPEVHIAGVLYPSVRTEGKGFNVAISPNFADTCLQLIAVGECTLYKEGTHIICDNDKQTIVKTDDKEFNLEPIIDPKIHLGRELVYKILNGEIKIH